MPVSSGGGVGGSGEPDGAWVVWRQDDNGNRFVVARRRSRSEADELAAELEARGHKQTYWVAPAGRPGGGLTGRRGDPSARSGGAG